MNTYRTVLSLCALAILNLDVCLVTEALQYGDQDKPSNKTDVEGYLRRYGYLTERSYSSASLGEMADALKKFQDFLQLNVTGQVDQATLKVMSMPRCGVSDVMNTEHSKVVKWNITRLTYKFIKYSQKISQNDARTAISNAFNLWAKSSKLNFVETKTSAMIEIQFSKGAHGDGYHFDGKFGVLAHAFFPIPRPIGGDTHFDDDEAWTIGGGKGVDLFYIATHEFGHALGLPHSGNKESVMKPYYAGYIPNLKLHSDDVKEIQKRYGSAYNMNL